MNIRKRILSQVLVVLSLLLLSGFSSEKSPVIYLIGDSTLADKPLIDNPERGWGQVFPYFFSDELQIENHAKNGRSTKNFLSEGRWQVVLAKLQKGDYVFIQFGHNDAKESDPDRYAPAHTLYKENLIKYVQESREKGAIPVLITPVMRRRFDDQGEFYDVHGDYPSVVKEVANDLDVKLIDLHEKSRRLIVEYGEEKSKGLFLWIKPGEYKSLPEGKKDDTHFSIKGAYLISKLVFEGVKELDLPIMKWYEDKSGVGLLNGKNVFGIVNEDESRGEINIFETELPEFQSNDFNITNYGAIGDGITLNTDAFAKAISECSGSGGGRVIVPKGIWLTGPITLMNNIDLHVERGAHIQFTKNFNDYPLVESEWEGTEQYRCTALINGRNLDHIAITGKGVIDGAGDAWRPVKKFKMTDLQWKNLLASGGVVESDGKTWWPSEKAMRGNDYLKILQDATKNISHEEAESIKDYLRPVLVSLISCKNILIDGPTFQNSPAWNIHPLMCENLIMRNITVRNPWYSQNGDGIDIESCNKSVLYNSSFDVGDDAICIKSGRDEHGRQRGMPTQNLVVSSCIVYHGHGGFTIGSEMSGGARNIRLTNCNFIGTDMGIRFKSTRGRGGIVENIFIDNVRMKDIPTRAISFNMFYEGKAPMEASPNTGTEDEVFQVDEKTPVFRRFFIDNITCDGAEDAIVLQGLPERAISEINFSNLLMNTKNGITISDGEDISISGSKIISANAPVIIVLQTRNLILENIVYNMDLDDFMKLVGSKTTNINLKGIKLNKGSESVILQEGAEKDSFFFQ